MIFRILSILALMVVVAGIVWWRWLTAAAATISKRPHDRPVLGWRRAPPSSLRRASFVDAATHLESLGFRELGTLVETALMRRVPSRQFVHEDGTIVGLFSVLRKPAYYVLSEFRGPVTLVFTGAPRKPKMYGTLLVGGVMGTVDEMLETHQKLILDAQSEHGPLEAVACESAEHRLEVTRRYYIERFTNEGRFFQPFENATRLKL